MNDLNAYDCSSALANTTPAPSTTGPYGSPVVAAAVGGYGSTTNVGNHQYTVGWQDYTGYDFYAQDVQAATGLPGNAGDYRKVNMSPITGTWGRASCMALSSSSNSGLGILATWYNGTNIAYKVTSFSGTWQFKPTSVNEQVSKEISIFPNPAHEFLQVQNASGAKYTITDITGHKLVENRLDASDIINISGLTTGLYLLTIEDNSQKRTMKFLKE